MKLSFEIEDLIEQILVNIIVKIFWKGTIRLLPVFKTHVMRLGVSIRQSPALLIPFVGFPVIATGQVFLIEPFGFWKAMIFAPLFFLLGVMLAQLNVLASKM